MNSFQHVINTLLQLLVHFGDLVTAAIVAIELWLRSELQQFGLPRSIQTVILVALAVLLIVGALRLFGGLIRVAVVLVLLLIAIHIMLPVISPDTVSDTPRHSAIH